MVTKRHLLALLMIVAFTQTAFIQRHYAYKDSETVDQMNDQQPSPLPKKTHNEVVGTAVNSTLRDPIVSIFDPRRNSRSLDVNAKDNVPQSTWYTPRLGYREISLSEIVKGPENIGPPQLPLTVIKGKKEGNTPGFLAKDSRGKKYLIKMDAADYPDGESTANFISNRLFWAFGYNVPEDFRFKFKSKDIQVAPESGLTGDDITNMLMFASIDENEFYTSTASLFIDGKILGPIPQTGTRPGDINDRIAHEKLRILRALKVFCAFTNNTGIRPDNSLDTYVGEDGKGYTLHYIVDFGETLGMHGVEKQFLWDGHDHLFSFREMILSYAQFGLRKKSWDHINNSITDPKTYFEGENFDFDIWKEVVQYRPIRLSRPEDDYWAAKILGGLKTDHLDALFEAVKNPDQESIKYIKETLIKRREKILLSVFSKVSPIESNGIDGNQLKLEDRAEKIIPQIGKARYEVNFFNRANRKLSKNLTIHEGPEFSIEIPDSMWSKAKNYIRVEVRTLRDRKIPPPGRVSPS